MTSGVDPGERGREGKIWGPLDLYFPECFILSWFLMYKEWNTPIIINLVHSAIGYYPYGMTILKVFIAMDSFSIR